MNESSSLGRIVITFFPYLRECSLLTFVLSSKPYDDNDDNSLLTSFFIRENLSLSLSPLRVMTILLFSGMARDMSSICHHPLMTILWLIQPSAGDPKTHLDAHVAWGSQKACFPSELFSRRDGRYTPVEKKWGSKTRT